MPKLRTWVADRRAVANDWSGLTTRSFWRAGLPLPDQRALLAAASPPRQARKDESLIEQGEQTSSLLLLCSGMARAVRTLVDGRQQIVAVFVAGDTLNVSDLPFTHARNSISALTPAMSLSIPLKHLNQLMADRPAIARALWLETAAQAAIQQEWMVWLGRHMAHTRLAHFLCEVSYRLQLSGPGTRDAFEFPLTQRELADTLGLSPVHVNRVLQLLRSQGLIELSRQRLTIWNRAGLYEVAEFEPRYLDAFQLTDPGAT